MANLSFSHGQWVNNDKPGGAVFFVGGGTVAYKGKGASDTNDGLTPQQPLSTIAAAHTKVAAGRGDTIVVLPGAVTITAAISLTKADVTLTGYTNTGARTRNGSLIVCATNSVEMIAIDGPNITVENLTLDHNATTAAISLIDVGDVTASPDFVLRNLFLDMEGSGTTTDGITINSDTISTNGLIEGCRIHDVDQIGIKVQAGNDEVTIRDCHIYDNVTANEMTYGIDNVSDGSLVEGCTIRTPGTACIHNNVALLATYRDCVLHATGANTFGILAAALSTVFIDNCYINVGAAGNLVDFTTSATVPSSTIAWGAVQGADPTIGVLITPTVDGT
jgi:hypothetical protein